MHTRDPFRGDQDFVPNPPVARVNDDVAYGPGLVVDEIARDMPDLAVGRVKVIPGDRIATAQVRIVVTMAGSFGAQIGDFFSLALHPVHAVTGVTWDHRVRIKAPAPHAR